MLYSLPDDAPLPNGQKFDLLSLALLGVPASAERFNDVSKHSCFETFNVIDREFDRFLKMLLLFLIQVTMKLQEIKFDHADYICLKFLLLLNPGEQCEHPIFLFFLNIFLLHYNV